MSAGEAYIAAITSRKADIRARAAFLHLATTIATPGSSIFDFGAGPGIDAKHYAKSGFHVLTYDVDPQMIDCQFAHCLEEIARGDVVPCAQLERDGIGSVACLAEDLHIDLVTANFAPFNLIDNPHWYFTQFHGILGAHGKLLLSVLNPCFFGDMKYGWWWRNATRLLLHGEYSVSGGGGPIYRRSPYVFARMAEPYFRLRTVLRGLPQHVHRRVPLRRLSLATSRYIFLLFDKCS